jgi:Holliday junction resolvase RusA-like endonuclease
MSASTGDLDKLLRSTNDALTGVLFDDDRQVISIDATRRYCDR